MPFQGFKIDESFRPSEGGRPYLPPGNYLAEVGGIRPSREEHDGYPYWRWSFRILKGADGIGRSLPFNATWKAEAQFSNASILQALGSDPTKLVGRSFSTYAEFQKYTETISGKLTGRKIGLYVADGDPYKGNPQSEVYEFFSEADYEKRAQAEAANPGTAAARPQPTAAAPSSNGTSVEDELAGLFSEDVVL